MANLKLIEAKTLGSNTASVTFTSIPQTYTDLKMIYSARATTNGTQNLIKVSFNGNTSSYSLRSLQGDGVAASSGTYSQPWIGYAVGSTATASTFSNGEMYVPNYTSSDNKSFFNDNVAELNGLNAQSFFTANLWSNIAAITSIELTMAGGEDFVSGSTFYLYGISNVTTGSKATGGIVSYDSSYYYHMFPYSGTFTPTENITADVLIIAGGGGGGFDEGGGGGAGGLLQGTISSLTANTGYTVTIGAGGAGGSGGTRPGTNGSNSVFSTHTATGGGGGGGASGTTSERLGKAGGSAGGGASYLGPNNGGTANQGNSSPLTGYGNNGGNSTITNVSGGGGGGAGAAGSNGTSSAGNIGKGGNGLNTWSSWATATQTGADNGYYAGGGGGTSGNVAALTDGGLGGGGKGGSNNTVATAGTANTGGGGGAGNGFGTQNAASGGSGIVIIRYAI